MEILVATLEGYVGPIQTAAANYTQTETPPELSQRKIAVIPFPKELLYGMSIETKKGRGRQELRGAREGLAQTIRSEHQDAQVLILGVSFETLPDAWTDTARFLGRHTGVASIILYSSKRLGQPDSFRFDVFAYERKAGLYALEHYPRLFGSTAYLHILEHADRLLRDILQPV